MSVQVMEHQARRLDRWEPVIGLEIHVQLATRTKMFCRCRLEFGAEPNTHVCPVCLAHPGALPVPNRRAVEFAVAIGLALGSDIAARTSFDRKNYFYADNPKAYQISQDAQPICVGGHLDVPDGAGGTFRVNITRAHMEEDAAKLVHHGTSGRIDDSRHSLVDFNRGGTPLVEIVTEPDLRSPEQVRRFLTLLRNTIRTIGVSDCNMEEGSLRCDGNISVRARGDATLGTKTELKNMNSFRFLERGIAAEISRQTDLLERGETISQQTLHFDPASGTLRPLRSKEHAHDYRYFPEPDLVPLDVTKDFVDGVRQRMPELPIARMARFVEQYELSPVDAEVLNVTGATADSYEAAVDAARVADAKVVANWTMGEGLALAKDGHVATPEQLAGIADLVAEGVLSGGTAKELLGRVVRDGGDPRAIVEAEDLGQVSDEGALGTMVDEVLAASPAQVEQYRAGKVTLVGYFVGQVMKASRGKADPRAVKQLVEERLGPEG